jgi:hypothetical protein
MADVILRGRLEPADERTYVHVPFEVPAGTGLLHVEYDYSERIASDPTLTNGNTLDIGLFDPRGVGSSSPGFRGWSGSHKLAFSLASTWATPPYVAGYLQAGTWHVLLGPYKVSPRGCEYEVRIAFAASAPEPERRPTRIQAARPDLPVAAPGWLRGDLHCHTLHSDGDSWPHDMLEHAVRRGLDFLGVTDHNQTGHHADYARVTGKHLPVLLPGIEVTTYRGHWNAWGTSTWWEFRETTEQATSAAMQAAAASGALVSVNHPKPFGPAWEYPHAVGYHAIEVWNGDWPRENEVSLAWWDSLLRAGRRPVALGGSDTHELKALDADARHGRQLGLPTTWAHLQGEATSAAILDALRAGKVFISRDVDGPQVYVSREAARVVGAKGATLVLIDQHGRVARQTVASEEWKLEVHPDWSGYLRAEVRDSDSNDMLALSNPLFDLNSSPSR